MEGQYDYKTSTEMTYRGWKQPIDIRKSNDNFKDGKLKCFNCKKYSHIAKKCWKKKEKETRKCFKCDKGHIIRDCKGKQLIKKQKIQEESDDEDNKENDKKKGFGKDLE